MAERTWILMGATLGRHWEVDPREAVRGENGVRAIELEPVLDRIERWHRFPGQTHDEKEDFLRDYGRLDGRMRS